MNDLVEVEVSQQLYERVEELANILGMTIDDVVVLAINRHQYLPVFAKLWDMGLNTYSKLSKAIDIISEHQDGEWPLISHELTTLAEEPITDEILPRPKCN